MKFEFWCKKIAFEGTNNSEDSRAQGNFTGTSTSIRECNFPRCVVCGPSLLGWHKVDKKCIPEPNTHNIILVVRPQWTYDPVNLRTLTWKHPYLVRSRRTERFCDFLVFCRHLAWSLKGSSSDIKLSTFCEPMGVRPHTRSDGEGPTQRGQIECNIPRQMLCTPWQILALPIAAASSHASPHDRFTSDTRLVLWSPHLPMASFLMNYSPPYRPSAGRRSFLFLHFLGVDIIFFASRI